MGGGRRGGILLGPRFSTRFDIENRSTTAHHVHGMDMCMVAMMTATARLVVQMSPREKRELDVRAKRAGVSTAEFVRRRLGADEIDEHREEIEALLLALEATAPAILESVDQALETIAAMSAKLENSRSEDLP